MFIFIYKFQCLKLWMKHSPDRPTSGLIIHHDHHGGKGHKEEVSPHEEPGGAHHGPLGVVQGRLRRHRAARRPDSPAHLEQEFHFPCSSPTTIPPVKLCCPAAGRQSRPRTERRRRELSNRRRGSFSHQESPVTCSLWVMKFQIF